MRRLFVFVNTARINVVILRPRPHKRLVAFFFVHCGLIMVVNSRAANSARTSCITRKFPQASCFFVFLLLHPIILFNIKQLFLNLQRHLYRVSHHSSAYWFLIAITIFINKTFYSWLLYATGIFIRVKQISNIHLSFHYATRFLPLSIQNIIHQDQRNSKLFG